MTVMLSMRVLLPAVLFLLSGCSGIDEEGMATALEAAWSQDSGAMAGQTGVVLPGAEPGELRGMASSAKIATDLARGYAGETGGDIAASAFDGASKLAQDFGVEGADDVRQAIGIATASDWTVRNLEVLSERDSGNDVVANVRYDLGATMQGTPVTIGRDITHQVRFIETDSGWSIERVKK